MEKKFKCQSCGNEFIADTNQYVTCPKCDSDNIALIKNTSPIVKISIISLASLIAITGITLAFIKLTDNNGSDSEQTVFLDTPATNIETPQVISEEQVIEDIEDKLPQEIVFNSIGTPAYDDSTNSYSITVTAKVQGRDNTSYSMTYTATSLDGRTTIANSTSGNFIGLKPIETNVSNPEASYQFIARAMLGNQCIDSLSTMVPGFKKVQQNVAKMSISDVQALIDNRASSAITATTPGLASNVRARCQGDMGGSPAPKSLRKLIDRISMNSDLAGARVISLEYDGNNIVTCVVYAPIMSND